MSVVWKLISDRVPELTLIIRLLSKSIYDILQMDINVTHLNKIFAKGKTTCEFVIDRVRARDVNMLIHIAIDPTHGLRGAKNFAKASLAMVNNMFWVSAAKECWPVFCWLYNTYSFPRSWYNGKKYSSELGDFHNVLADFRGADSPALIQADKMRRIDLECYIACDELTCKQAEYIIDMLYGGVIAEKNQYEVISSLLGSPWILFRDGQSAEYELKLVTVIKRLDRSRIRKYGQAPGAQQKWEAIAVKHNIQL